MGETLVKDDVLELITLPAPNPLASVLERALEEFRDWPQIEMPVTHRFLPGVYMREVFMPAGSLAVGHVHRTPHVNIVLSGKVIAQVEGKVASLEQGAVFESQPGVQKAVIVVEDTRWLTVHPNPSDGRDVVEVEERIFQFSPDFLAEKGDRTLDEARMARSKPQTLETICPE